MRQPPLDRFVRLVSWGSTLLLLASVATVIGFLLIKGYSSLSLKLVFGDTPPMEALLLRRPVFGGLFPAMVGTFSLVVLAITLAVPLGLAAGIYMAEYGRGRIQRALGLFFDILAGVPSIVVGLFGFSVAVFLHRHFGGRIYPCLLISALSLAFLVLPYLIRTTQNALEALPEAVRLTAPALGATRLQNICFVLLPRALPGILSGVILAIGRCAEDTAVIMLTGVVATAGLPRSLFSSYEALPFYIYYISSQYRDPEELATGYAAALILLAICAMLFAAAALIQQRLGARLHQRL
ncbi:MAG: phosphate ABC transporter permease PstA [Desulfobacteraceae bacterium]|nr:phosphate ABC transporter permease PstA [Desulfobacteraceae bacterium]MDD3992333.1 phosphate ABC transporter permease PstA [Desulfobacteraceae bacterium]